MSAFWIVASLAIAYGLATLGLIWGSAVLSKRADARTSKALAKDMPPLWELR